MQRAFIILASLLAGLVAGIGLEGGPVVFGQSAKIVGSLWLNALQATVLPLVVALLISGVMQTASMASAGRLAGKSVALMVSLLILSSIFGALIINTLLSWFPVPPQASAAFSGALGELNQLEAVPRFSDFLQNIIPTNIFGAAAEGAMLPVILFTLALAFAMLRLPEIQRTSLAQFFDALGQAMIIIVNWVLLVAPLGVFALAFTLGSNAGGAALGGLAHYVLILVGAGGVIWLAAIALARFGAGIGPLPFLRASLPAQSVALSTQSSLATLPAMFTALREMGVRRETSEIVLPIAVAIFRVSSPAFNLGVALYIAHWMGVELSLGQIATGVVVASVTTLGSVSLPGSVSFIGSIAPICIAMGLPVAPLGLLVAIETFPDLMRTLSNVTMDMSLTATIDKRMSRTQ